MYKNYTRKVLATQTNGIVEQKIRGGEIDNNNNKTKHMENKMGNTENRISSYCLSEGKVNTLKFPL